ncbi:hypothetical protein NP493_335g04003 [Ridgeia piscesae]|uniref:Uncharacterized protein n=1 Tax=Ridgeia piscesae TaxID=27915 RepID=A0AAD9NWA6_RIDPI|nr:hypothetical protein NP493_335g04003 [Ridgeia piscesae]
MITDIYFVPCRNVFTVQQTTGINLANTSQRHRFMSLLGPTNKASPGINTSSCISQEPYCDTPPLLTGKCQPKPRLKGNGSVTSTSCLSLALYKAVKISQLELVYLCHVCCYGPPQSTHPCPTYTILLRETR